MLKKALNTKIDGVVHLDVVLLVVVISLDLELVYKVREFLSNEKLLLAYTGRKIVQCNNVHINLNCNLNYKLNGLLQLELSVAT